MKKKITALILLFVCIFSISSCKKIVPAYNAEELETVLENQGYEIVKDVEEVVKEGVTGYLYAVNQETDDEIYYIYCEDASSARSLYNYIKSKQEAKIAELKMEIDRINFALDAEEVSAAEKGDYYERLILRSEELEEVENYGIGRGVNIVWFGTKQAIKDIKNFTADSEE